MRYLGNKTKLLGFIDSVIQKYGIKGEVFADLFAGTGAVSDYFKDKYKILSNDWMYYAFVLCKAKTMNCQEPKFDLFRQKEGVSPFDWLNQKKYEPTGEYFIYHNYTPIAGRMFFTESNAIKIDGIRIDIEDLYQKNLLKENEYFYLLASLLESVTKVSNTSGTYEAFFKFWESRATKLFILEPLSLECKEIMVTDNKCYNEDANKLVRMIKGDIIYIDTPYTITQYASAYHILETIARYDDPEIAGKTGRRQKNRKMSGFSRKKDVKILFEDLFRQINFNHVLISYSNQGLLPLEDLIKIAERFAIDGVVHIEELPYREYKNLNMSQKGDGTQLKEVIIYFQKDIQNIKSPLNYSGSKDVLLPAIFKELPPHVGTFVDAMGGAFNVGVNMVAMNRVIYNEYNPFIFPIIEMLLCKKKDELLAKIENNIKFWKLSQENKETYLSFREHYNFIDKSSLNLFILHMFSFQNLIRFNSRFEFNTPIGNSGYTENMKQRIIEFKCKTKVVEFYNNSFEELSLDCFEQGTIFYFDPPYLITTAEYNDGKRGFKGWNSESEVRLLAFLHKLDKKGFYFMLSNVITHRGKTNNLLAEWIKTHDYNVIEIGKTGSRYPRVEILVKNFK